MNSRLSHQISVIELPNFSGQASTYGPFSIGQHGLDPDPGSQVGFADQVEFHADQEVASCGFLRVGIDADLPAAELSEGGFLNSFLARLRDADDATAPTNAWLAKDFDFDGIPPHQLSVEDLFVGCQSSDDPLTRFELHQRFTRLEEPSHEITGLPFREYPISGCPDGQPSKGFFEDREIQFGLSQLLHYDPSLVGGVSQCFDPLHAKFLLFGSGHRRAML